MDRTGFRLGEVFTGARERGKRPLVDLSSYELYMHLDGGAPEVGGGGHTNCCCNDPMGL